MSETEHGETDDKKPFNSSYFCRLTRAENELMIQRDTKRDRNTRLSKRDTLHFR